MFIPVFESLISLFMMMLAGFYLGRKKILTESSSEILSTILVNISMPCLIVMSMQREFEKNLLLSGVMAALIFFILVICGYFLSFVLLKPFKLDAVKNRIWTFALIFTNCGYMGIPIVKEVFGERAVMLAALVNVVFNALVFTLGIVILSGGEKVKLSPKMLLNPSTIAAVVGILLFSLSIRIYEPIGSGISAIGAMTSPISMFIVGSMLARSNFKEVMMDKKVFMFAALRLLVFPIAAFFVLRVFITDPLLLNVIVFLFAMPSAAITVVFAVKFKKNPIYASQLVFITTLLSMATLPFVSLLLPISS